jgi:CDK-activating kinase assembly factor MAT1
MDSIRANQARDSQEASSFLEQQSFEQEQARLRRQAVLQEYDSERREVLAGREDVLSRLAAGKPGDVTAIAREGHHKVLLKKSSARRSEEDRLRQKQAALRSVEAKRAAAAAGGHPLRTADTAGAGAGDEEDTGLGFIKGLKKVKVPEPEKPYDPFGGLDPGTKRDYYVLQDHYPSSWLDRVRDDVRMQAGGYDLREYYSRTLLEAFAGLGCFVDEEISEREATSLAGSSKSVATDSAAAAVAAASAVGHAV